MKHRFCIAFDDEPSPTIREWLKRVTRYSWRDTTDFRPACSTGQQILSLGSTSQPSNIPTLKAHSGHSHNALMRQLSIRSSWPENRQSTSSWAWTYKAERTLKEFTGQTSS